MQKKGDGSIIGYSGQRYGLQLPAARQPGPVRKSTASAPKPADIFGLDEEDEEEDVGAQVARQAERKRSATKVQQMYEAALAEDPNVFNYDEVYDSIQQARVQPRQQEKIERKSRYIGQLKEQAEQRKREEEIRYERRLLKERQVEDHLFEGKEKFVTAAYRKKLEEDKKWQEEQKKREEEEERNDVRKVGHLGNFYANLLTKNVAMGAHTTAEKQPTSGDADASVGEGGAAATAGQSRAAQAAAEKVGALDKYEVLRLEAERARKASAAASPGPDSLPAGAADHIAAADIQSAAQVPPLAGEAPGTKQQSSTDAGPRGVDAGAEGSTHPSTQEPGPAPRKRRNDDNSVMSARERYLARKRQES